jgi:GTPase
MPRAGIVTLVGRPNAGKSTLLNRLVGQKLSIVSSKAQSTRDRVVGIRTVGETQMVLFDTPGLLDPTYALQHAMRRASRSALADADVIVYIADATQGLPPSLTEAAFLDRPPTATTLLVLNKVDAITPALELRLREALPSAIFLSADRGDGIDTLVDAITATLPEGQFLYPGHEVSTQPVRYFVSELVRETALDQLDEEVPYSVACEVEEFREDRSPVYIRAVLYVERESQKRILVGAAGGRVREIGTAARAKIERLVGERVYLDLWVKVLPNWRRSPSALLRFGYRLPGDNVE